MVALVLVLFAVGCSSGSAEAERAFNDGTDSLERGLYEEAIAYLDKAIQLAPDDAGAYLKRGVSYKELGEYQNAINDYTMAIQIDPDYADAYNGRGISY